MGYVVYLDSDDHKLCDRGWLKIPQRSSEGPPAGYMLFLDRLLRQKCS